ncbi:MAG TPA: hypothetical protein VFR02_03900, partial [bacterium]|nr:hypothetical protein [bacterium]
KSLDRDQIESLLGGTALTAKDYGVGSARLSSQVLSPSYNQPGATGAGVTITLGSGGAFVWDGRGDDGRILSPGNYYLELKSVQPNTAAQQVTWDIVVLPGSGGPPGQTLLAPNPIRLDQTQTARFQVHLTSPLVDNVVVRLYTLAGERMDLELVNDPGNPSQVTWNLAGTNIASGMYLGVVELRQGRNLLGRQVLKIAILH